MKTFFFTTLALVILPFFVALTVFAQTEPPCGNIITPANFYNGESEEETRPILDCTNPFGKTEILSGFKINNDLVNDEALIVTPEQGWNKYGFDGDDFRNGGRNSSSYYLHIENDFVAQKVDFLAPTENEIKVFINNFFGGQVNLAEKYIEIYLEDEDQSVYFQDENYEFIIDPILNRKVIDVYYDISTYIDLNYVPKRIPLTYGTYSVVEYIYDGGGSGQSYNNKDNLLKKIASYLLKTANAQGVVGTKTITFSLVPETPEPAGASSVLFLPGIQASRLYKDGLLGTEDQIWEPNISQDVEQLAMTEEGDSANQIYTKENEVMLEIAFPTLGTNIYKSFAVLLNTLKTTEVIKDWTPFAYDWRLDVNDVAINDVNYKNEVKNLVLEIENLASSSYTGKVTIIGHSNGGLVGKMLISELDRQGKADLVDKLVMIGTPQLGAPKAVLAMLHGYDQQALGGLLVTRENARAVIRNMPGVYGLLPSAEYFDKSPGIMISADNSNTTASIRSYNQINSKTSLDNFLTDSLDQRTDNVPINEPLTLNNIILQGYSATKQKLDSWLPPSGVEVYEVVGTGNATIKGFEYQAFPCTFGYLTCSTGSYMKAVPIITSSGDETVPVVSASGQDGDKVTGYIDLISEGQELLINRKKHLNLTESPAIKKFVESIIKFPYLNETLEIPDYTTATRNFNVVGVHSPVSLVVTDSFGNKVGKIGSEIKEEILGSQYLDLGDSTYVIIPDEILFTAEISGQATGTYSVTIDTLKNDSQTKAFRYIGASTTPVMKANFAFATSGFTSIKTDINGDGVTDLEQTLNGQVVLPSAVSSYSLLKTNIKGLQLSKLLEILLLLQVDVAIYWDNLRPIKPAYQKLEFAALDSLKNTLLIYRKKKYITQPQYSMLELIINNLRK